MTRFSLSRFVDDRRAVSFTVSHAITVGITAVLVIGIIGLAGGAFHDQKEATVRNEMATIGDRISTTAMGADSLAQRGENTNITLKESLPQNLAGETYQVHLLGSNGSAKVKVNSSTMSGVSVSMPIENQTAVENSSAAGGDMYLVVTDSDGKLKITNDPPEEASFDTPAMPVDLDDAIAKENDAGSPNDGRNPRAKLDDTRITFNNDTKVYTVEVDWKATDPDGNLDHGQAVLIDSTGTIIASEPLSMSGNSSSGTTSLQTDHDASYITEVTAVDSEDNKGTESTTVNVTIDNTGSSGTADEPAPTADLVNVTAESETYDCTGAPWKRPDACEQGDGGTQTKGEIEVEWLASDSDDDLADGTITLLDDSGNVVKTIDIDPHGGADVGIDYFYDMSSGDYTVELVIEDSNGDTTTKTETASI